MATDPQFVEYLCEQARLGSALTYKKMFGEYALYLDDKVIALVCDNQLFVKPTVAGRQILGEVAEHPPYPGAKPYFRLGDEIDDDECLRRLFKVTAQALPPPKTKPVQATAKVNKKLPGRNLKSQQ